MDHDAPNLTSHPVYDRNASGAVGYARAVIFSGAHPGITMGDSVC